MEQLLKLLRQARRQGSTTALLKASAEYNGIVVVHDMQYARELKRANPRAKVHSVVEAGRVNDCMNERGPILVDNGLIINVCEMGLSAQDACDTLMAAADKHKAELRRKDEELREARISLAHSHRAIEHVKYSYAHKSVLTRIRIEAMKVNRKIRSGAGFKSFFASL